MPTQQRPGACDDTKCGAAPRHAARLRDSARAQESLDTARPRRGSFVAYRPNIEREAVRKENVRSTDKIVAALNERRILLAFEPLVRTATRELAFYECLMRIRPPGRRRVRRAPSIRCRGTGLVRLIDHRVIELVTAELSAAPGLTCERERISRSITDAGLVVGARRAFARAARRRAARSWKSPKPPRSRHRRTAVFVTRAKDLGCRIAIDDFGAGLYVFPQPAPAGRRHDKIAARSCRT